MTNFQTNYLHGKFIVIEGLDGSGQSTQVRLLKEFLKKKNFKVFKTKEPTKNSKAGKLIREILDKKKKLLPKSFKNYLLKIENGI